MARGNKNYARGGFRESSNDMLRGRGRGGGRGGRGYSRGRGGPPYMDEFDLPIQQWPSNEPPATPPPRGRGRGHWTPRGNGTPRGGGRGRGRGRGSSPLPYNVFHNSRRGLGSPQESGRGRGDRTDSPLPYGRGRNLPAKLRAGVPLSKLLHEDRPLLKPIIFVRSVHTATLFEKEDDIFLPVAEPTVDGNEQSHVPTANAVSRVFSTTEGKAQADLSGEEEEQLEEIDFADIGRIQAEVDAAAANSQVVPSAVSTTITELTTFFVDTTPAPVSTNSTTNRIQVNKLDGALGGAAVDDDEEVIVYVAPHPRTGKSTPQNVSPPIVPLPSTSILTGVAIGPPTLPADGPSATRQERRSSPAMPAVTSSSQADTQPQATFSLEMGTLYPESAPPSAEFNPSPDATELPPPPSFDSVSFAFAKTATTVKKQSRRLHPVGTPRALLKRSRHPRRKPLRGFGSFGAAHEEAMLREVDPRRDEQRRGDSDVNWGTSDEDDGGDGVDALSADMGGMELDGGIDLDAMKRFVHGMSAQGSAHVTMDDVADIERMKREDEEEERRGPESADEEDEEDEEERAEAGAAGASSERTDEEDESDEEDEEIEAVLNAEEELLIAETMVGEEDEDENSEDEGSEDEDEDEDETPRRGFQARLERLRASTSKGKGKAKATEDSSDDEAMSVQMTWADEDEEWLAYIDDILDENAHILGTGSRKARKYMFKAIQNGSFDFDDGMLFVASKPARRRKDKGNDLPPELHEQWEKDRQKKAENKRRRAEERQKLAADPLAAHKGGKKGRKAMLAAARAADELPNRVVDFVSLEQQIRRFLEDIGGRDTMVLPPCDKETRKRVHDLAGAFNLKSQSKGSGSERYTTLIKTSKSGLGVKEGKIRAIMRKATDGAWDAPAAWGKGRGRTTANLAKHREGEEVGKDAAKIGESNIGFKMLAAMGWSDGNRIGLSGGLDAPLTAIMKKTKLGLGATM
ncbi:hypothetical protein DICSQDRAFT_98859 [Dichomitus squalens LYAD-421 SS1]|uniref:uncharacterized protein n=1 Tax=Dichomitus squalens (strain LYAD-421) TaxID=732165 RepID=UPI000441586F|nr:uncharacterized protein DICSQDRAFT_98859 [Dichomitus squalens LYAD-421 SS1]EJF65216.1 hypothetical protein DICSQDRAFT_98859 [Dichomitus squalens LYAD-421 SS1]